MSWKDTEETRPGVDPRYANNAIAQDQQKTENLQPIGYSPSGIAGSRRPTLAEEHEKRLYDHRDQALKAETALAFFRANPAFDEFIRLVRQGIIQF